MAAWTHYSTSQVGKKSKEIFTKYDFETVDADVMEEGDIVKETERVETEMQADAYNYRLNHIEALVNLMKIDNKIHEVEKEFINDVIGASNLSDGDQNIIRAKLESPAEDRFEIEFAPFKKKPDLAVGLLIDLIALAKRDNEFHVAEKIYIKQVAKLLEVSDEDLAEMMGV